MFQEDDDAGRRRPAPSIRPAGYSDDDSDSDDDDLGFAMSGPSRRNRAKVAPHPPNSVLSKGTAAPAGAGSSTSTSGIVNGNGNTNNDLEDWGDGIVERSPPRSAPGLPPLEMARIACCRGEIEKIEKLLDEKKINVNTYFNDGNGNNYTPLLTAAAHGQHELVKFLLQRGADVKVFSRNTKDTALMAAAGCSNDDKTEADVLECAKLLLEAGCPVDNQNNYALTALMIAVKRQNQRRDLAKYLLDKGANPDIQDFQGRTCLFYAAEVGDGRTCRVLLEKGANVVLIDDSGWSAYDVAGEKAFYALAELLHKVRSTKWTPEENPSLMKEIEEYRPSGPHSEVAEGVTVKEDSQIDMILSAMNAGKYTENFRRHKVTYLQFLQFDETDLEAVGIDEVGIRKKLLQSIKDVHNTNWHSNSLKIVPSNKKITAAETICIINNIKHHVEHIQASLQYLRKRIGKDPRSLKFGLEKNKISDIIFLLGQLDKNNFHLAKETLESTYMFCGLKDDPEFKLGDYLELKPQDMKKFLSRWNALQSSEEPWLHKIFSRKWLVCVGGAALISGVFVMLRKR